MSEPTPKTEVKPESEHINVKVTDSSTDVYFKIKKSTQLKKVFDAFCKRTGKEARGLRFLYEGERISEQDTPASLDIHDGDTIEAHNEQLGGY
ncbi:similar to Saccharomyces cerevisiae YDR510W SMT3 Ubiquitin-like protein of the SUMO family [Geotrichum candidum]|uniref:Similar to Saccharomyces cerevisiae YDR510W SMT3 Ubiquitin-like protein of the SUMO family n=1 Tax=Geotrichum candidum TaxID=1173061 RepID=A0A0J9YHQ5_GEOCN|nr:similar to Saccharomyces cerevisiae YDR510W SMT3 Ubiquitin-like protein of the SUMO family [Geotrichum candidum]